MGLHCMRMPLCHIFWCTKLKNILGYFALVRYNADSPRIYDIMFLLVCYGYLFGWLSFCVQSHQPLWVILCRLPEKGRKWTEELVK